MKCNQLADAYTFRIYLLILLLTGFLIESHAQSVSEITLVSDPNRSVSSSSSGNESRDRGAGGRRSRTEIEDGIAGAGPDFNPIVTAKCERGIMTVSVVTSEPFYGVLHARDWRKPRCIAYGNGTLGTSLSLSLLATNTNDEEGYCGITKAKTSEERSLAIAVRPHRTLELSDDKYYVISCAHSGFRNARNALSQVSLKMYDLETETRLIRVVQGRAYRIRAELSSPDGINGIQVRNCFSFSSVRTRSLPATPANDHSIPFQSDDSTQFDLIGRDGCPVSSMITPFEYNATDTLAWGEAELVNMFKFPSTTKVHIQCDVILCRGGRSGDGCPTPICGNEGGRLLKGAALDAREAAYEGAIQLLASTTVYVVDEGDEILALAAQQECTEWRFPWLIALCICLAILLLIMLLVNIFLCSSLSCSCVKTEVLEREPSEIDEYDPYNKLEPWLGPVTPVSQYGSRTSLHKGSPPTLGYMVSGGGGNDSDEGVVHTVPVRGPTTMPYYSVSRPGSRYSTHSARGQMPDPAPAHLYSYR